MFVFFKKCFFTELAFLSTLTGVNSLTCISMNNKKCKVRLQIIIVNVDNPAFFSFSIKASECSSSCNNTNNPCAKLCVPNIVKYLNVKAFNLVAGANKTRRIEWHETCKCKCRFEHSVCNNKQRWNDHKCRCKELIDKLVCNKGFIWNPSNCEGKFYKSCDFSECLHYKNWKFKKD